jgi:2-polyprenyl-6-methoxyphenol hydroxylase-like FAD-dependent oxidoreductase
MPRQRDLEGRSAVVVGCGPAGLATALALRETGLPAVAYERKATLSDVGAGITLWPNALAALEALGVAGSVFSEGAPVHAIEIRSSTGRLLDATPPELMRRYFGAGGLVLHRSQLQRILARAVGAEGIRLGTVFTGFSAGQQAVTAHFDDDCRVTAALLVGADGEHSRLRQSIARAGPLRYAGYTVWRGLAHFGRPDPIGTLSIGRGAQFGLFPLNAGRVYWFASLSVSTDAIRGDGWRRENLLHVFAGWHRPVRDVIAATNTDSVICTPIYISRPPRGCGQGRVALVGDAAHPGAPALGQGAGLAMEDAVVLARCVGESDSIAAAVRAYERKRLARTTALVKEANRIGSVGQWRNPLACWLRDRLIEHSPQSIQIRRLRSQFTFTSPPVAHRRR